MITLNKKQCQQLKHVLADLISKNELKVYQAKIKCAALYEISDKDAEYGTLAFKRLNMQKDNLRAAKQKVKMLSELQWAVKERLKHP